MGTGDFETRREHELFDELSRLNNELVTAQRELAKANEKLKADAAELDRRVRELLALRRAASVLQSALGLESLQEGIVAIAHEMIPAAEKVALIVLDRPGSGARVAASRGFTDPRIGALHFDAESRLCSWLRGSTGLWTAVDARAITGLLGDKVPELAELVSAVLCHVVSGDDYLGALLLGSATPEAFLATDVRMAESLAATAGASIRTAQYHAELTDAQAAFARAQQQRAELAEQLGQEISHRVRNHLAMAVGVLQVQAGRYPTGTPEADVLRGAISRLQAFASLSDLLYAGGKGEIELTDAIRRVADINREALSATAVDIEVTGEPVRYPTRAATHLCIVANELITNGLKHGAPTSDGRIHLRVGISSGAEQLQLTVWSSGNPVAEDFGDRPRDALGLHLVAGLASRYGGGLSLQPEGEGTLATVVFENGKLRPEA
jgi:two-component sensor histidine kinase